MDNVITSLRNAKKKVKEIKIDETHRLCTLREEITHDIWVTPNKTLPSKPIRTISVDRPRQVRRVNKTTSNWASYALK